MRDYSESQSPLLIVVSRWKYRVPVVGVSIMFGAPGARSTVRDDYTSIDGIELRDDSQTSANVPPRNPRGSMPNPDELPIQPDDTGLPMDGTAEPASASEPSPVSPVDDPDLAAEAPDGLKRECEAGIPGVDSHECDPADDANELSYGVDQATPNPDECESTPEAEPDEVDLDSELEFPVGADQTVPIQPLSSGPGVAIEFEEQRGPDDDGNAREFLESEIAAEEPDEDSPANEWDVPAGEDSQERQYNWPVPPGTELRKAPLPWLDWRASLLLPVAVLGVIATMLWSMLLAPDPIVFRISDADSGEGIAGARLVVGTDIYEADSDGVVVVERPETPTTVDVSAEGYRAVTGEMNATIGSTQDVPLRLEGASELVVHGFAALLHKGTR